MIYAALALGGFALVVSLGALALAFLAARRSADTSGELRRHREAHGGREDAPRRRHGDDRPRPSPRPPVPAPADTDERARRHAEDEDRWPTSGQRPEDEEWPETGDLPQTEAHHPPTAAIPRVPRPGQLR